ncbi:hypothetical protein PIB30_076020, partial [Stylosanthes scabra]|nr:hypothetical protein [Stylosanthes scabra]
MWRINARILRLWRVSSKFDKSKTVYVEKILMDDKGIPLARLISKAKLIIWDEAPMI